MKSENRLNDIFGKDSGMRVPENYFPQIFSRISASLPEQPERRPMPLSRWQRLKPYVYLAAMFAGIWCTLKMVTMMSEQSSSSRVSLDNPPALVAQAMATPEVADLQIPAATATLADAAAAEVSSDFASDDVASDASDASDTDINFSDIELIDPMLNADIDIDQLRAELNNDDDDEYSIYDYNL